MIAGYNSDEGTLFFPTDAQPSVWLENMAPGSRAELVGKLSEPFPTQAETLVDMYDLDTDFTQGGTQMMGDEIFGVNIRMAARAAADTGAPSWTYFFSRVPPSEKQTVGAFHAAEIPFVFGSHEKALGVSDDDAALTETMIDYWANFAKTGNPNSAGMAEWPQHTGDSWMHFSANTGLPTAQVETGVRREKLDALSEGLDIKLDALNAVLAAETEAPATEAAD
jgi:para-nitrobenzyl esterase